MGVNRYVYNKGVNKLKETKVIDAFSYRNELITYKDREGNINSELHDWELEVPKDIRNGAIRDLDKAFTSTIENLKAGNIFKFEMKYRCKKNDTSPSLELPLSAITTQNKRIYIYKSYTNNAFRFGNDRSFNLFKKELESKEKETYNYDCRLSKEDKRWFLIVSGYRPLDETEPLFPGSTVALDPGVRKFMTAYSENMTVKFKTNKALLKKLHDKLDTLQSIRDLKHISSHSYKRGSMRIRRYIKNMTNDLHNKIISMLIQTYSTIVIPKFDSQKLLKQLKKCGTSSTCRTLQLLQHYKFRQKLISKIKNTKHCDYIICTEEYTSKTCSGCGQLNKNLGSSELFICSKCDLHIDRDINAARNILIKVFKEASQ